MEKKDNKKCFIWLFIVFLITSIGLSGYIIYDKIKDSNTINKTNKTSSANPTTNDIENNNKNELENNGNKDIEHNPIDIEIKNYENKKIIFDFKKENTNNIMELGFNLLERLTEDKYNLNITISNIVVNGNTHSVKIKNWDPYISGCEKGIDEVIYFDDKIIYEPFGEWCWLSELDKIRIFKNQYIILEIYSEDVSWIYIFDENGNELKSDKKIGISQIENMNDDSIIFIGWDYDIENQICKDNKYKLIIEDNKIIYQLIKTGENEICMNDYIGESIN